MISGSGLGWSVPRPPLLNNMPTTGDVRIFSSATASNLHDLTCSDLASFMVDLLTPDDHLGEAVTMADR